MNKFEKYWLPLAYLLVAVVGSILLYACGPLRYNKARMAEVEATALPKMPSSLPKDSISRCYLNGNDTLIYVSDYRERVAKVDTLYANLYHLSEQYREETSILVDRTGSWMGYWIAIICLLTGIGAYISYKTNESQLGRILMESRDKTATLNKDLDSIHKSICITSTMHALQDLLDIRHTTDTSLTKVKMRKYIQSLTMNFREYSHYLHTCSPLDDSSSSELLVQIELIESGISKLSAIVTEPVVLFKIQIVKNTLQRFSEELLAGGLNDIVMMQRVDEIASQLNDLRVKMDLL